MSASPLMPKSLGFHGRIGGSVSVPSSFRWSASNEAASVRVGAASGAHRWLIGCLVVGTPGGCCVDCMEFLPCRWKIRWPGARSGKRCFVKSTLVVMWTRPVDGIQIWKVAEVLMRAPKLAPIQALELVVPLRLAPRGVVACARQPKGTMPKTFGCSLVNASCDESCRHPARVGGTLEVP